MSVIEIFTKHRRASSYVPKSSSLFHDALTLKLS
jgi:hypothetical protein